MEGKNSPHLPGEQLRMNIDQAQHSQSTSASLSPSRSKRSTTNLANLRLAPLSTKYMEFAEEQRRQHQYQHQHSAKTPHEEAAHITFARQHSSYLQGRSAPSTPGILSRSSSRKHIGGGLSRRGSLYDDDVQYQYAAVTRDTPGGVRVDVGSGQIPKAKSEATLLVDHHVPGHGVSMRKKAQYVRSRTGTHTPVAKSKPQMEEDWFSRTRASTNALVQEAKGQSWLASRESSTSLAQLDSDDDDDDEGYEEMAALSASQARLQVVTPLSPVSCKVRSPAWGSRYGSRSGSRRTSRRGSLAGIRTPVAGPGGQDGTLGYFDQVPAAALATEPDFVDPDEDNPDDDDDERHVFRLTGQRSFGLGGIVDRLMGFNLFNVDEREEITEDEAEQTTETADEAKERMAAENRRKREAKVSLTAPPPDPVDRNADGQGEGGWQDAAWLLSVATKVMF
ncbi:MAG: hypothetical protein FE78DRAFT_26665 [Acidomyces sp. 'richmondensis']|nr:MAG: hypothetical protein FE78DRAFT_26665 [Acidomyces sp. 'richmondensis']